ncbi:MAG: AraC family transcriptional regulator [Clostridia bacterium]|nr:AraC family transcriptional regulator [Clostridia bacterium]
MKREMYYEMILERRSFFDNAQSVLYEGLNINGMDFIIMGIHYTDYDKDWSVKKHKHSFYELHYIVKDCVYTVIKGIENRIEAGQFYLMPPYLYHSHHQDPGTSHVGFALRWDFGNNQGKCTKCSRPGSEMDKIVEVLSNAHSFPVEDKDGVLIKRFTDFLDMAGCGSKSSELKLAFLLIITCLYNFYSGIKPKVSFDANNNSFLENGIVGTAIEFIEDNYVQDIDVNDVAMSVHMSYSHLSRLFKKYTGETINYHINKIRLQKAQKLLSCTDKKVEEVAAEVGFNSVYYFCNTFKKFYGISPKSYKAGKQKLSE